MHEYNDEGFIALGELGPDEQETIDQALRALIGRMKQESWRTAPQHRALRTGLVARYLVMRYLGLTDRWRFEQFGNYSERGVRFHVVGYTGKTPRDPRNTDVITKLVDDFVRMQDRPQYFIFVWFNGLGDVFHKKAWLVGHMSYMEVIASPYAPTLTVGNDKAGHLVQKDPRVSYALPIGEMEPGAPSALEEDRVASDLKFSGSPTGRLRAYEPGVLNLPGNPYLKHYQGVFQ